MAGQYSEKSLGKKVRDMTKQIGSQDDHEATDGEFLTMGQMKAVLAASPAGIGIVVHTTIVWANENLTGMLEYECNGLRGKPIGALYPSEAEFKRSTARLNTGMARYGAGVVETRLSSKEGNEIDCRIRTSRLDPGDPDKGVVVVVTDISELKSLQIQLQQAQKMEAIGVLAGGISHDFNNILMGIQGHLSLMRINMEGGEKMVSHVRQIGKLVGTAAELTNRLLGFARGGKYQIAPMDVNQLLSVVLSIFKPSRKDLRIHEAYQRELYTVEGDGSQFEQVFLNLLVNASEAIIGTGDIFVSSHNMMVAKSHDYPFYVKPGPYVKVIIRDTGMGMEKKVQAKIFDPFFSTKEVPANQGRGLGLSTVFGIVKNHGGFITVESEKGRGSSFQVCLPALSESGPLTSDPKAGVKEIPRVDPRFRGTETFLVANTEGGIFSRGKDFLTRLGYKVILVRDVDEAVNIFTMYGDEIPMVIIDSAMPHAEPAEIIAGIKQIRQDVKILITDNAGLAEGKVQKIGCHGLMGKYTMPELIATLRSVLDEQGVD